MCFASLQIIVAMERHSIHRECPLYPERTRKVFSGRLKTLIGENMQEIVDSEVKDTFEAALQGNLTFEGGIPDPLKKKTKKRLLKIDYIDLLNELQDYLEYQFNCGIPTEAPTHSDHSDEEDPY